MEERGSSLIRKCRVRAASSCLRFFGLGHLLPAFADDLWIILPTLFRYTVLPVSMSPDLLYGFYAPLQDPFVLSLSFEVQLYF